MRGFVHLFPPEPTAKPGDVVTMVAIMRRAAELTLCAR